MNDSRTGTGISQHNRGRLFLTLFLVLTVALIYSSFRFGFNVFDSLYYGYHGLSHLRFYSKTKALQLLILLLILVTFHWYLAGLGSSLFRFLRNPENSATMTSFLIFFVQFGLLWPFMFVWTEEGIIWTLAYPSFVVITEFIILHIHLEDYQIRAPWPEAQVYDSVADAIPYLSPSQYSSIPPINTRSRRLWQLLVSIFLLNILLIPKFHPWGNDFVPCLPLELYLLLIGKLIATGFGVICCFSLIPLFFVNIVLYFKYRNLVNTYLPDNHRFRVTTSILKTMAVLQPIIGGIYWLLRAMAYYGGN